MKNIFGVVHGSMMSAISCSGGPAPAGPTVGAPRHAVQATSATAAKCARTFRALQIYTAGPRISCTGGESRYLSGGNPSPSQSNRSCRRPCRLSHSQSQNGTDYSLPAGGLLRMMGISRCCRPTGEVKKEVSGYTIQNAISSATLQTLP